jgi:hypothetical protein
MAILHGIYLLLTILVGKSIAQNTPSDDTLSDVCQWTQLRAATVRDAVYVNGGNMRTAFNGYNPIDGSVYTFNFSQPFQTSNKSFSALFTALSAPHLKEDYFDGTIFATDEKIYLYGYDYVSLTLRITSHILCRGLIDDPNVATPPGHVVGYQLYSTGSGQMPSLLNETLSVSSYITDGAGVNVPSESLGFYFSGMEAPGGVEIQYGDTTADTPSAAVESFIQAYMPSGQETQWSNLTWPTGVKPRANAQLVWLPVSSQGVLIVIGGVVDPQNLLLDSGYDNASQITDSQSTSPGFMTSLPVYDVGTQRWFTQDANGEVPGQLTEFCSVVAQADGSSTFEIYIYGGYDGLNGSSRGDVWVLSVPDFIWIHAYDPGSDLTHARDSHACVKPYPDQMFVIGGETIGGETNGSCISGGVIDVFNLNNLTWQNHYDPTIWANYTIPSIVASKISATPTATSGLSAILGTKYQKNIPTYYPYPPPSVPKSKSSSNSLPIILGAVLGVVGFLFILFVIWWFFFRKGGKSVTSETQSSGRGRGRGGIYSWARGVPYKPDASVTTTEVEEPRGDPLTGYYEAPGDWKYRDTSEVEAAVTHRPATPRSVHAEADGVQMYEMHATNTHPTSPRSAHVEADGAERFEMHVVERGSPDTPAEMATSYRIKDHSFYPRDPAGASQTMSPTPGTRSTTSHDASSPSPYVLPQGVIETGYATSHPAADSPQLPSPDQSPPMLSTVEHRPSHKRNVSSMSSDIPIPAPTGSGSPDLDDLERLSGLGYPNSRPVHTRNMSSLSSGIAQLPSPAEQVLSEEDQRRSALLNDLPSPSPASPPLVPDEPSTVGMPTQEGEVSPESQALGNYQTLRNARTVVTRKQVPGRSAFGEEFESP